MYADDAMAIFFALKSPELDVIGLTTIFGNVQTVTATVNAIHLVRIYNPECLNGQHGRINIYIGVELNL